MAKKSFKEIENAVLRIIKFHERMVLSQVNKFEEKYHAMRNS